MISYSEIIEVPLAKVWDNLLYKIEHPEHFLPGVSNVLIREKTDGHIIRQMDMIFSAGELTTLVEKITYAPYQVKFTILEHPTYTGYVDNLAEVISDQKTKITYSLNWLHKESREVVNNHDIVKAAVLKTVDFILKSNSV